MKKLVTKTVERMKTLSSRPRKKYLLIVFVVAALTTFILGLLVPEKKMISRNLPPQIPPATSPYLAWQTYEASVQTGEIPSAQKVLEVTVLFDRASSPQIAVTSLDLKNAYPSRNELPKAQYIAQLLGENGSILSQYTFNIETQQHTHFVTPEGQLDGDTITSPHATAVVNLAWFDAAKKIRISDNTGALTTLSVEKLAYTNNQPQVQTIQGDKIFTQEQKLNFHFVPPAYAASTQKLAITFVGDKYSDSKFFEEHTNKLAERLISFEPFKSRASQIQFYRINSDVDFGCTVAEPRNGRPKGNLICNSSLIKQYINTRGAPGDFISLISSKDFLATGGEIIYAHTNDVSSPNAWVHEVGHQFGTLIEEYVASFFQNQMGPIDNQVHGSGGDVDALTNPTGDGNCYAGIPPAKVWENIAKKEDFRQGCTYANWHRSTENSIMHDLQTNCFNKASQRILNKRLDQIATPAKEVLTDCPLPFTLPLPKGNSQITPTRKPQFVCLGGKDCTLKPEMQITIFPTNTRTPSPTRTKK